MASLTAPASVFSLPARRSPRRNPAPHPRKGARFSYASEQPGTWVTLLPGQECYPCTGLLIASTLAVMNGSVGERSSEWIEAGYFIVSDTAPPSREGCFAPPCVATISTCIVDSYPDDWALPWASIAEEQLQERRASLGLERPDFAALRAWVSKALESGEFGWPNVFLSLGAAREFSRRFLGKVTLRRLFGASAAADVATRFLHEMAPQRPNAGSGTWIALSRNRRIEPGGRPLGFDIVGAEWGGNFHTFWCNGLEREFETRFGIRVNQQGLLDDEVQAQAACEYVSRPEVAAEPCCWYPVRVSEYEFGLTD
jgi:hypothetical protein